MNVLASCLRCRLEVLHPDGGPRQLDPWTGETYYHRVSRVVSVDPETGRTLTLSWEANGPHRCPGPVEEAGEETATKGHES
jgi:hypothetical protein